MPTKNIAIRLSLKDAAAVERGLKMLGADGQRALAKIESSSRPASKGLLAVNAASRELQSGMAGMAGRAGTLGAALTALGPAGMAAAAAGAAITLGWAAALKTAREATRAFADLAAEAETAGLPVEEFQEFQHVALSLNVTQEALTDGMKELALRADEFGVTGGGTAAEAFQRIGLEQNKVREGLRDLPGLFTEVIRRMENLGKAAQIRIADELFGGTGGEQFVRLVNASADEIARLRREAHELGLVISQDVVDNAREMEKQFKTASKVIDTQLKQAFIDLAPVLLEVAKLAQKAAIWIANMFKAPKLEQTSARLIKDLDEVNKRLKTYRSGPDSAVAARSDQIASAERMRKNIMQRLESVDELRRLQARLNKPVQLSLKKTGDQDPVNPDDLKKEPKRLQRLAESWKNQIMPSAEKYRQKLLEIENLHKRGLLSDSEALQARKSAHDDYIGLLNKEASGIRKVKEASTKAARQIADDTARAFDRAGDRLADFVIKGKVSFKSLTDFGSSVFNEMLTDMMRSMVRSNVTKPLTSALSGLLGSAFGGGGVEGNVLMRAGVKHGGGMVGAEGPSRIVTPNLFKNASRLHGGGFPGLRPGERPIIAEDTERVMTAAQQDNTASTIANLARLAKMSNQGGTGGINLGGIHIDARSSTEDAVIRLERSLPGKITEGIHETFSRDPRFAGKF